MFRKKTKKLVGTPALGDLGPMIIICLLKNTVDVAFRQQIKINEQ